MRRPANKLVAISACCAVFCGEIIGASAAQASNNPLIGNAGIYKLGIGPGTGSTGIPYALRDGTTGTLTARHAVGGRSATRWPITNADGDVGYGVVTAASSPVDTAFLEGSAQWTTPPDVKLSSDYSARFAAVAKSRADVVVGERICRTGWSPLDGTGDPSAGSPNLNAPPDIAPSTGASVICGRVTSTQRNSFWIGRSDRPDGAIIAQGDSGGMVWKVTDDGAFMFLGLMTGAACQTSTTIDGFATYSLGNVQSAWAIDSDASLNVHPLMRPDQSAFLVISTSTYHPAQGSPVTLHGSLRDRDGSPIANTTVQVLSGAGLAVLGTTTTDSKGNLIFRTPPVTGTTSFAFRWNGDAAQSARSSRVISVWPTRATIDDAISAVSTGTALRVNANISDSAGTPVAARTVTLRTSPDSRTPFSVVATGTTDAHGNVTLTGPAATSTERYQVRLSADPCTNGDPYGAAESSIRTVRPS